MVNVITILFVMMIASVVQAQALVIRTVEKQCTPGGGCRQITGTGACVFVGHIDNRSIYVTAAHNLRGNSAVYVGYGGQWWQTRTIYRELQNEIDYAIIETQKISSQKCFQIASVQPANNVDAVAYGYSNGIYNLKVLRAKIRVNRNGRVFSKIVAKGDSGGPIIANGQVVGIISGHDYQNTIYTDGVIVRQRLISLYGRMPSCGSPVIVVENEPIAPKSIDSSKELTALQGEVSKLRQQLDLISKIKIPVWIVGADDKVISKKMYPLGDPIKFKFKAVRKDGK
ncbi:MAG: hypothetical protein QM501_01885 [Gimesia sp.]